MSTVIIAIKRDGNDVQFDPASETAAVGDDVYWRNEDGEAHWPAPPPPADKGEWLDDQIPGTVPGQPPAVSDGIAFGNPGTYAYICALHPGEAAEIVVS